eukprot:4235815-Alexandrium_andersonii.AAC.1
MKAVPGRPPYTTPGLVYEGRSGRPSLGGPWMHREVPTTARGAPILLSAKSRSAKTRASR